MKGKFYSDTTKAGIKMVITTESDDEAFVMAQFIEAAKRGEVAIDDYVIALPTRNRKPLEYIGASATLCVRRGA